MSVPKTPKEFNYDLWIAADGRNMVRVKRTGEECEVDRDTMRFLRAEEKRLRRAIEKSPTIMAPGGRTTTLSLDYISASDAESLSAPSWLAVQSNPEDLVVARLMQKSFVRLLTPHQAGVYNNCIVGDMSYAEYAAASGVCYQRIQKCVAAIRKKAKKFFE